MKSILNSFSKLSRSALILFICLRITMSSSKTTFAKDSGKTFFGKLKCNSDSINPGWVSGFVDDEGCFSVSFSLRKKMKMGIEVRPSFSVSQKAHSRKALENLKELFGVGAIRYSAHDGTYKFEVRNLNDLTTKVIPFFEKNPLATQKKNDFEQLKKICNMMKQSAHLNEKGLTKLIDNAFEMNPSGIRKYSKEELKNTIQKNIKREKDS